MFNKLISFFKSAAEKVSRAITPRKGLLNGLRSGNNVGELAQRFTPTRVLRGFRLARTGKHRGTTLPYSARQNPPGTKLWKKAASV
jgi:hypothetical protein